jgi:hypothetical protein
MLLFHLAQRDSLAKTRIVASPANADRGNRGGNSENVVEERLFRAA